MEIIFLGTCSAFSTFGYQTNLLINQKGKNLLVDAGGDIKWSLKTEKLSFKNIDSIYASHGHGDHVHGLEYIGDCRKFSGLRRPELFVEGHFAEELWDEGLKLCMKGLQGHKYEADDDVTLKTYFDVHKIKRNGSFDWQSIKFEIVQMIHVTAKYSHCNSFGLMFNNPDDGKRIFITTDCQYSPESSMLAFYEEADYIVHDCETTPFRSGVHPNFMDMVTLPEHLKSKMVLDHYNFDPETEWEAWNKKARDAGFIGFARPNDRLYEIISKSKESKNVK